MGKLPQVIMLTVLAIVLVGCAARVEVPLERDTYTKAEVDARQAVATCKHNARTIVQIMRC